MSAAVQENKKNSILGAFSYIKENNSDFFDVVNHVSTAVNSILDKTSLKNLAGLTETVSWGLDAITLVFNLDSLVTTRLQKLSEARGIKVITKQFFKTASTLSRIVSNISSISLLLFAKNVIFMSATLACQVTFIGGIAMAFGFATKAAICGLQAAGLHASTNNTSRRYQTYKLITNIALMSIGICLIASSYAVSMPVTLIALSSITIISSFKSHMMKYYGNHIASN